jgi:hypothetical protein
VAVASFLGEAAGGALIAAAAAAAVVGPNGKGWHCGTAQLTPPDGGGSGVGVEWPCEPN